MLRVEGLCKRYEKFELRDVGFELPAGFILGFIGRNGAGKTTTLKSMLNVVLPDAGKVTVCGLDMARDELEIKQMVGYTPGAFDYYPRTTAGKIAGVYRRFYRDWDELEFEKYIKLFALDLSKKISELSSGMKVKLGLALALSHHAKLLILDEPTSGLDPIARDELLDIFREIIESGERSILFSTHITSDLDKCADYIVLIRNGRVVLSSEKDRLIDGHTIVKGTLEELERIKPRLVSLKKNAYGFSGLMRAENVGHAAGLTAEKPNLEDIMLYYERAGEDVQ